MTGGSCCGVIDILRATSIILSIEGERKLFKSFTWALQA